MDYSTIKSQMQSLIDNAKSFITGEPDHDDVWQADIEACNVVIDLIDALEIYWGPNLTADIIDDNIMKVAAMNTLYSGFDPNVKEKAYRAFYERMLGKAFFEITKVGAKNYFGNGPFKELKPPKKEGEG